MAGKKITVVISQTQGKNPQQRHLEEEIATALILDPDVDVSLVPHLYDLTRDHTGMLFLKSVPGDMLVLSWLFPRAARWILDRNGVKGREGVSLLEKPPEDDDDADANRVHDATADSRDWLLGCAGPQDLLHRSTGPPDCGSLSGGDPPHRAREFRPDRRPDAVDSGEPTCGATGTLSPSGKAARYPAFQRQRPVQRQRFCQRERPVQRQWQWPTLERHIRGGRKRERLRRGGGSPPLVSSDRLQSLYELHGMHRLLLFGVYGVDRVDRILVEQQDNCKKGCPACSRVCPENAIMFPGHKTAAIAGAESGEVAGLKIDLSKLFGPPTALELAAQERDTELVADGREAVGMTVGIPKRQSDKPAARDELDDLMDGLDTLGF